MAKEPSVFGFGKQKAATLSRVADREGFAPGPGSFAKYPQPGATGPRVGFLTSTLAEGGTAQATELYWNGDAWTRGEEFTVTDFFLNDGESVDANCKIIAFPLGSGIWVAIPYCAASDTIPPAESGGSAASGGGATPGGLETTNGIGGVMLAGPDNFTQPGFLPQEAL